MPETTNKTSSASTTMPKNVIGADGAIDLDNIPPELLRRAQERCGNNDDLPLPEKMAHILGNECSVKRVDKNKQIVGESKPEEIGQEVEKQQRFQTMVG